MGAVTGLWLIRVHKNCLFCREFEVLKGLNNMLCRRELRLDFCLGNPDEENRDTVHSVHRVHSADDVGKTTSLAERKNLIFGRPSDMLLNAQEGTLHILYIPLMCEFCMMYPYS